MKAGQKDFFRSGGGSSPDETKERHTAELEGRREGGEEWREEGGRGGREEGRHTVPYRSRGRQQCNC